MPKPPEKNPDRISMMYDAVRPFLTMSTGQIIEKFSRLPNAQQLHCPSSRSPSVFIPGKRNEKVCLVAHSDTVFDTGPTTPERIGTLVRSAIAGRGIGADDRAGCYLLWQFRNLGHSILLCSDEEKGLCGANDIVKLHLDKLKLHPHQFMLEFDRRDAFDIATYGETTPQFINYLTTHFPGYSEKRGSCTDISRLAPALGLCAANLSVGYFNEHRDTEMLDLLHLYRTEYLAGNFLRSATHPLFEYVAPTPTASTWRYWERSSDNDAGGKYASYPFGPEFRDAKEGDIWGNWRKGKRKWEYLTDERRDTILAARALLARSNAEKTTSNREVYGKARRIPPKESPLITNDFCLDPTEEKEVFPPSGDFFCTSCRSTFHYTSLETCGYGDERCPHCFSAMVFPKEACD